MTTRYIKLDNQEIFDLVEKKGLLVEEGRKLMEPINPDFAKIDKLNKKINKLVEEKQVIEIKVKGLMAPIEEKGAEVQEIKQQIIPMVEEAMKSEELGEYEVYTNTEIKDGELVVAIVDELENFKSNFTKK